MTISRRAFIQTTLVGGATISAFGFDIRTVHAQARTLKISRTTETRSTCPYCSVSCGVIIHTLGDRAKNVVPQVVHVEGDPDHPINEGALCSKGAALYQVHHNERRLRKIRYRRPGGSTWEELSWDQAVKMVADRVKKSRDATWVGQRDGLTINHTSGIACLGGAALDTEECYLLSKAMRGLGVVWLEHQARI